MFFCKGITSFLMTRMSLRFPNFVTARIEDIFIPTHVGVAETAGATLIVPKLGTVRRQG